MLVSKVVTVCSGLIIRASGSRILDALPFVESEGGCCWYVILGWDLERFERFYSFFFLFSWGSRFREGYQLRRAGG